MHEPIIEKIQFDQAQLLVHKNKKTTKVFHENSLKGKLRFNDCGKTFSLAIRSDRSGHRSFAYSTYRCDTSKCTSHYITYDYLKDFLSSRINEIIWTSRIGRSKFVTKVKRSKELDKKLLSLNQSICENAKRLNEVDDLTKKLFEKYVSYKISEDKFYELDKTYDLEKIRLVKFESKCEAQIIELIKEDNNINVFFDLISKY